MKELLFRIILLFLTLLFTGLWIETGTFDVLFFSLSITLWILLLTEVISYADSLSAYKQLYYPDEYKKGALSKYLFKQK